MPVMKTRALDNTVTRMRCAAGTQCVVSVVGKLVYGTRRHRCEVTTSDVLASTIPVSVHSVDLSSTPRRTKRF